MLPVDVYQPGDCLIVENLADQVEERSQRNAEQFRLVAGKGEAADRLVSQQDEIGEDGHRHAGIVPLYDLVRVKLPPPPGGGQRKLPAVAQHDTLALIPADAAHDALCLCQFCGVFIAPDVHALRGFQNGQSGEVALYADALYLLYAPLEVPVAVAVSEDAAPLRVSLAALGLEMQGFLYRNEYLFI